MDFFGAQDIILWYKKFKISSNFKHNIDETHSTNKKSIENPYEPMDFKNLRKKPRTKSLETWAKC